MGPALGPVLLGNGFVSFGRGADTLSDLETASDSFRARALAECLSAFPEVTFAVTGHCMGPDLAEGRRVVLVGRDRRPPRIGDVVLTGGGGALRLHRLVWRWPFPGSFGALRTKADRAAFLDPALRPQDVLGLVVAVEGRAYARRPGRALRSLLGAAFLRLRAKGGSSRPRA